MLSRQGKTLSVRGQPGFSSLVPFRDRVVSGPRLNLVILVVGANFDFAEGSTRREKNSILSKDQTFWHMQGSARPLINGCESGSVKQKSGAPADWPNIVVPLPLVCVSSVTVLA